MSLTTPVSAMVLADKSHSKPSKVQLTAADRSKLTKLWCNGRGNLVNCLRFQYFPNAANSFNMCLELINKAHNFSSSFRFPKSNSYCGAVLEAFSLWFYSFDSVKKREIFLSFVRDPIIDGCRAGNFSSMCRLVAFLKHQSYFEPALFLIPTYIQSVSQAVDDYLEGCDQALCKIFTGQLDALLALNENELAMFSHKCHAAVAITHKRLAKDVASYQRKYGLKDVTVPILIARKNSTVISSSSNSKSSTIAKDSELVKSSTKAKDSELVKSSTKAKDSELVKSSTKAKDSELVKSSTKAKDSELVKSSTTKPKDSELVPASTCPKGKRGPCSKLVDKFLGEFSGARNPFKLCLEKLYHPSWDSKFQFPKKADENTTAICKAFTFWFGSLDRGKKRRLFDQFISQSVSDACPSGNFEAMCRLLTRLGLFGQFDEEEDLFLVPTQLQGGSQFVEEYLIASGQAARQRFVCKLDALLAASQTQLDNLFLKYGTSSEANRAIIAQSIDFYRQKYSFPDTLFPNLMASNAYRHRERAGMKSHNTPLILLSLEGPWKLLSPPQRRIELYKMQQKNRQ